MFPGFTEPTENWSKLPHSLIGALPDIRTVAELKVILYILRHTWATLAIRSMDLPAIAKVLGHESIATTALYTHADQDRLDEQMRRVQEEA